jgi:hypothetical protein
MLCRQCLSVERKLKLFVQLFNVFCKNSILPLHIKRIVRIISNSQKLFHAYYILTMKHNDVRRRTVNIKEIYLIYSRETLPLLLLLFCGNIISP